MSSIRLSWQHLKDAAKHLLEPCQVGVGTKGGAEAVVRAVNVLVQDHGLDASVALLKIDFENAFNKVDRSQFLHEVDAELPSLSRWARWCYQDKTHLWFNDTELESAQGVQQGDPIGPLLFALALRKVTARIAEKWPDLLLSAWYLDDGTVIGNRDTLGELVHFLGSDEVRSIGMQINMSKCEVWWPTGNVLVPELPLAVVRAPAMGTEVLKIPIGSDNFIAERLLQRVTKMGAIVDKLDKLEDAHVEFTLLRACLGSTKLAYALRGVPPSNDVLKVCAQADDITRLALERILCDSVGDKAWEQAGFSTSSGGLGLRHAEDMAAPAFLGSVADTSADEAAWCAFSTGA